MEKHNETYTPSRRAKRAQRARNARRARKMPTATEAPEESKEPAESKESTTAPLPKPKRGMRTTRTEKRVLVVELPLRMRAANLGGIAARSEKLNALKASALRADIHRVDQTMEGLPMIQQALLADTAKQLKQD